MILTVSEMAIVPVIRFPHTNLQGQLKLLSAWKPGFLMTKNIRKKHPSGKMEAAEAFYTA